MAYLTFWWEDVLQGRLLLHGAISKHARLVQQINLRVRFNLVFFHLGEENQGMTWAVK